MKKLTGWVNYSKNTAIMLDFVLIVLAFCTAALFLGDMGNASSILVSHQLLIAAYMVVYLFCFYILRLYNYIWAQAGVYEYFKVLFCGAFSTFPVLILNLVFLRHFDSVRLTLLGGIFACTAVVGIRVLYKVFTKLHRRGGAYASPKIFTDRRNVLIYGAGTAAAHLIEDFENYNCSTVNIVGIIDDDPSKKNRRIRNVTVLGGGAELARICAEKKVNEIIIAIPSLHAEEKRRIVSLCRTTGCRVRITPDLNEIMHGRLSLFDVRDVRPEDLLGRHPVRLDTDGIAEYLSGKVVLITGGGGSIGSELCRQVLQFSPRRLVVVDIYENNVFDLEYELGEMYPDADISYYIASVRDEAKLDKIFEITKPNIVFHAAAHKHVPLMEQSPDEAVKNNVFGTLNAILCADRHGAQKFILISTDKAVNPTNIMGATKRLCEKMVQAINPRSKTDFMAVRFGNVMGSNGSVIPLFKKQIKSGGPVTVTHKNVTRFFMTTPEAAQLVIQACAYAEGGEIFVLDMGEPVRIYDMARELIELSGLVPDKDITIKFTGLRPGEKLYEELIKKENLKKTRHDKILVEKPEEYDFDFLMHRLKKLEGILERGDSDEIKREIKSLVPTYSPEFTQAKMKYKGLGIGGSSAAGI